VPLVPNNGKLHIDLDGPSAVADLVEAARVIDPLKAATHFGTESRVVADIEDHLFFLSATNPGWFAPFRDEAVIELSDRLPMNVDVAANLLGGCSEVAVDAVMERLRTAPESWRDLSTLVGIGSESALSALADHVRREPPSGEWVNRLGVHVPTSGQAVRRFAPERTSMHAVESGTDGVTGLALDAVAADADEITWHYLSFDVSAAPGLPNWPHQALHLVSPRTYWFTLHSGVADDGRYTGAIVDDQGEPFDVGLEDCEANPRSSTGLLLRPYDADLTYRNGHIFMTPGVVGTAGGAPIGLDPTPNCPGCNVLMFHGAAIESRDYGEGFRSVFYCEQCVRVAVTGSNWN